MKDQIRLRIQIKMNMLVNDLWGISEENWQKTNIHWNLAYTTFSYISWCVCNSIVNSRYIHTPKIHVISLYLIMWEYLWRHALSHEIKDGVRLTCSKLKQNKSEISIKESKRVSIVKRKEKTVTGIAKLIFVRQW